MSSDSDDDCYGNVSEKLQKMKDQFEGDKAETANWLDDSAELDEIVKKCGAPANNTRKSQRKASINSPCGSVCDLPNVSVSNASKKTTKRTTRSSTRNMDNDDCLEEMLPPTRTRKRANAAAEPPSSAPSTRRGRGGRTPRRGRGRASRRGGRGGWQSRRPDLLMAYLEAMSPNRVTSWDPSIPTYSVGNTDEYPDQSDSQALFSNQPKTNDVVVVEDEVLDDNEELSVKVYWQSSEFFKFSIRMYQKISQIFDYFAKKENVSKDNLLFTYNDRILKPDDTPESIEYSIVKFIDGGIVSQGVSELVTRQDDKIKDGINIKFQCQNMKKPFELMIRLDDKLTLAMMKCSEHLEKPLDKLRFDFDGDSITGKLTARELDFEGGECIDVRIVS